jgi:hypothetical protein
VPINQTIEDNLEDAKKRGDRKTVVWTTNLNCKGRNYQAVNCTGSNQPTITSPATVAILLEQLKHENDIRTEARKQHKKGTIHRISCISQRTYRRTKASRNSCRMTLKISVRLSSLLPYRITAEMFRKSVSCLQM